MFLFSRRDFGRMAMAAGVSYEVETIESRHQATPTFLRVARPKKRPVKRTVLVLPVIAGTTAQWGDGFYEALALRWPERFGVQIAAPSFAHVPWYADHPVNPKIAQEKFLLEEIVPRLPGKILLLGFSKSGNGALTLLLRHPDKFAAASAWDSPLLLDAPGRYESGVVYGTAENFAAYALPALFEKRAAEFRTPRISITGHASFQKDTEGAHEKLAALGVPHHYANDTQRAHHWASGWMEESMAALDGMVKG